MNKFLFTRDSDSAVIHLMLLLSVCKQSHGEMFSSRDLPIIYKHLNAGSKLPIRVTVWLFVYIRAWYRLATCPGNWDGPRLQLDSSQVISDQTPAEISLLRFNMRLECLRGLVLIKKISTISCKSNKRVEWVKVKCGNFTVFPALSCLSKMNRKAGLKAGLGRIVAVILLFLQTGQ